MEIHALDGDDDRVVGDDRVVRLDDSEWLREVRVLSCDGRPTERRTDDVESLLLVLEGTHDLSAGSGSWLRRGLRKQRYSGRPVALFLPPETPYRTENGTGSILVFAARQPAPLASQDEPKAALSRKPLLALAGSGKAYDPASGTWKPAEAFLASAEAILPRRIERVPLDGGAVLERIIGADYKALSLCVDEVVVHPGKAVRVRPPRPVEGYPAEFALYVATEGAVDVGGRTLHGERVVAGSGTPPQVRADEGRCYCAIAYAGPKSST